MHIPFLILAALAAKAPASDIVWEPLYEPGCGGAIVSLAVSPHNPRHLVSGGDMLGTAASFDAGETWKPGMGLPSYEMATPTFHPTRADELWIGSCMGLFLSRDGGNTWQWRRNGMPKRSHYHYTAMIEKVLVDPADPNRLLAFGGSSRRWGRCETMGAIWVSENSGDNWRRVGTITGDGFTTNAVKGANIVKAWWSAEASILRLGSEGTTTALCSAITADAAGAPVWELSMDSLSAERVCMTACGSIQTTAAAPLRCVAENGT